jgi:hypothetical protein
MPFALANNPVVVFKITQGIAWRLYRSVVGLVTHIESETSHARSKAQEG